MGDKALWKIQALEMVRKWRQVHLAQCSLKWWIRVRSKPITCPHLVLLEASALREHGRWNSEPGFHSVETTDHSKPLTGNSEL